MYLILWWTEKNGTEWREVAMSELAARELARGFLAKPYHWILYREHGQFAREIVPPANWNQLFNES